MKKKILSIFVVMLLMFNLSFTLLACKEITPDEPPKPSPAYATLSGLYVTGDSDETIFSTSSYSVYNNGSTEKSTDAKTNIATAGDSATYKVTKAATQQTYESVFWKVTDWDINKHLQFTVTVKNNSTEPVNVRILLASVDGSGDSLGPTNVHHGDGYASDTNYTLGGGATRTYRVTQDPDALYDVVSGEEKSIAGIYMRFNTHGTMLGAADVTITNPKMTSITNVFDIADFAPLYGSSYHKVLTGNYNETAKTLSSALYMGATGDYAQKNWGFDSQTSAWDETANRYLHYKLVNVADDNTNLKEYGVTLNPVKGTGSSADALGDYVHESFDEENQTITGVIDLNDYSGFTTLRININDNEAHEGNVVLGNDGIYVVIEAHIMYSNSSTAAFGTLPTLGYTIPTMPEPIDPDNNGNGDLTGVTGAASPEVEGATVTLVKTEVVDVDGLTEVETKGGVVNKLVTTIDYSFSKDFNKGFGYTEFAGVVVDLSDFNDQGLSIMWNFINVSGSPVQVSAKTENASKVTDTPGTPSGGEKDKTLEAGQSIGRATAIPCSGNYGNLVSFKFHLGGNSGASGRVTTELWFVVNPPNETLAAPVIAADETDARNIKWTAVPKATGYDVYVGATKVKAKTTDTSFKLTTTDIGTHGITVVAVGNGSWLKDSVASNKVDVVIEFASSATALTAPVISIDAEDDKKVVWTAVANATGYNVYVNDELVVENGEATTYVLAKTTSGDYKIKVKAIGNYTDHKHSELSNEETITVENTGTRFGAMSANDGAVITVTPAANPTLGTVAFNYPSKIAGAVTEESKVQYKGVKWPVLNFDPLSFNRMKMVITNAGTEAVPFQVKSVYSTGDDGYSGVKSATVGSSTHYFNLDGARTLTECEMWIEALSGSTGTLVIAEFEFYEETIISALAKNGDAVTVTALEGSTKGGTVAWNAALTSTSYAGAKWTIPSFQSSYNRIKMSVANTDVTGAKIQLKWVWKDDAAEGGTSTNYSGWKTLANGDFYCNLPNGVEILEVEFWIDSQTLTEGSFDITYFGFYTDAG